MIGVRMRLAAKYPGINHAFGVAVSFVRWAEGRRSEPTVSDIMTHYNVSRSTAYKWRTAYRQAIGMDGAP